MKRLGVGGFMTEFGAVNGTQGDIDSIHFIVGATLAISDESKLPYLDAADLALQSWTYWQYKFYQCAARFGIYASLSDYFLGISPRRDQLSRSTTAMARSTPPK